VSRRWRKAIHELLERLTGGDRRSIGRSNEVGAFVLDKPSLFGVLLSELWSSNPLIRMRAADALEKITVRHTEWLHPYKEQLIAQVAQSQEQEVRWHVAQMFPRLQTSQEERAAIVAILLNYLGDTSKMVKTFATAALTDLAEQDAGLRPEVLRVLEEQTRTGSPAMQSRGRKLLHRLRAASIQEDSLREHQQCARKRRVSLSHAHLPRSGDECSAGKKRGGATPPGRARLFLPGT
jgi:hypothetical protein